MKIPPPIENIKKWIRKHNPLNLFGAKDKEFSIKTDFSDIARFIGHLIKTADGFRFFNWEKNGYGDPSFSLFKELVEQRLQEREISNLLWVLWIQARQNTTQIENNSAQERLIRVRNIL